MMGTDTAMGKKGGAGEAGTIGAEGPVPGPGLRGVAELGSSTWCMYKPLGGKTENRHFCFADSYPSSLWVESEPEAQSV